MAMPFVAGPLGGAVWADVRSLHGVVMLSVPDFLRMEHAVTGRLNTRRERIGLSLSLTC